MSIYVKLEEDDYSPKDEYKKTSSNGIGKVIPPAPPIHIPDDDRYEGYGEALFASNQEYTRPMKCHVVGTMPDWIQGTFIRIGPGRYEWGDTKINHFFDGDAIAHRFTINDGKVEYQSKFLNSKYHKMNEKYNRVSMPGFGTWAPPDPCANIFRRIALYFIPNVNLDNANINVFNIQGKTYASTELPWMLEIDKETLDTIKEFNARDTLSTTLATWCAHPHFDRDGNTWFVSTKRFPGGSYQVIKIPPTPSESPLEGLKVLASIECGSMGAGYYHSFCITDNFVIVVVNPLFMEGICGILTMNLRHKAIADVLQYYPEHGVRFHVIDRHTGEELRECRANGNFFFHSANSYETDEDIVMDVSSYEDDSIIRAFYMKSCLKEFRGETISAPNLQRYRLPKRELRKKDPEPFKLPLIPEQGRDNEILGSLEGPVYNYDMVNGRDYTYCYGFAGFILEPHLVKVNVKTKETIAWHPEKHVIASLPYFFGRPGAKEEDDGVLVTNCTGIKGAQSCFVVIDAKTMKEICRANMPVDMGLMLHSNFFFD